MKSLNKKLVCLICAFAFVALAAGVSLADSHMPPQDFVDAFNAAVAGGQEALDTFREEQEAKYDINTDDPSVEWFDDLYKEAQEEGNLPREGGAPDVAVYTDFSNVNIITDADGNITGFEDIPDDPDSEDPPDGYDPGDVPEMADFDLDDNGVLNAQEFKKWSEAFQEWLVRKGISEHGGGPGAAGPDADEDYHPGRFRLNCWNCEEVIEYPFECRAGWIGDCNPNPCDAPLQCRAHVEVDRNGNDVSCFECINAFCEEHGYFSTADCANNCELEYCVGVRVTPDGSIRTGTILRGDELCYMCKEPPPDDDPPEECITGIPGPCTRDCEGENVFCRQHEEERSDGSKRLCHRCLVRTGDDLDCAQGTPDYDACNALCTPYDCVEVGDAADEEGNMIKCWGCPEREEPYECWSGDPGSCAGFTCPRENEQCVDHDERHEDGRTVVCRRCRVVTGTEVYQCRVGSYGDCAGVECGTNERCVPFTEEKDGVEYACHQCRPLTGLESQCEKGTPDLGACQLPCSPEQCVQVDTFMLNEEERICWGCPKDQPKPKCGRGNSGNCNDAECDDDLGCVNHHEIGPDGSKIECHTCRPVTGSASCVNALQGGCSPNPCPDHFECSGISQVVNGNRISCHNCKLKEFQCSSGVFGPCDPFPCPPRTRCTEHKELDADSNEVPCHKCNPMTGTPPPGCTTGIFGPCIANSCPDPNLSCTEHEELEIGGAKYTCHTCRPTTGDDVIRECHYGTLGACLPDPCPRLYNCFEHQDLDSNNQIIPCHNCELVEWSCRRGFFGPCSPGACPPRHQCTPHSELDGDLNQYSCHTCQPPTGGGGGGTGTGGGITVGGGGTGGGGEPPPDEPVTCPPGADGGCHMDPCESNEFCHDFYVDTGTESLICHTCDRYRDPPEAACERGRQGNCDFLPCAEDYVCYNHRERIDGVIKFCYTCLGADEIGTGTTGTVGGGGGTREPYYDCTLGYSGTCTIGFCADNKVCQEHVEVDPDGNNHTCRSCQKYACQLGWEGSCDVEGRICEEGLGGGSCTDHRETFDGTEFACFTCGDYTCRQGIMGACSPGLCTEALGGPACADHEEGEGEHKHTCFTCGPMGIVGGGTTGTVGGGGGGHTGTGGGGEPVCERGTIDRSACNSHCYPEVCEWNGTKSSPDKNGGRWNCFDCEEKPLAESGGIAHCVGIGCQDGEAVDCSGKAGSIAGFNHITRQMECICPPKTIDKGTHCEPETEAVETGGGGTAGTVGNALEVFGSQGAATGGATSGGSGADTPTDTGTVGTVGFDQYGAEDYSGISDPEPVEDTGGDDGEVSEPEPVETESEPSPSEPVPSSGTSLSIPGGTSRVGSSSSEPEPSPSPTEPASQIIFSAGPSRSNFSSSPTEPIGDPEGGMQLIDPRTGRVIRQAPAD